jgi:hypothetical protein
VVRALDDHLAGSRRTKYPLRNTIRGLQRYLDDNLRDVGIELTDRSGGHADIAVSRSKNNFDLKGKQYDVHHPNPARRQLL